MKLLDTVTGVVVKVEAQYTCANHDDLGEFMWTEGNYACDCNRALFHASRNLLSNMLNNHENDPLGKLLMNHRTSSSSLRMIFFTLLIFCVVFPFLVLP